MMVFVSLVRGETHTIFIILRDEETRERIVDRHFLV